MEENNVTKISLSTFLLILAIITIIVMGLFIYKLSSDKIAEIQKSKELQAQINSLNDVIYSLQEKTNIISNDTTDNITSNNTVSSINNRLYTLYSNQRYLLLMDDNTYGIDQDFLNKKTYILDLNMINTDDMIKEIDLSSKLTPFVNEYINKNKGSKNGTCTVEYFGVEDMLTPLDINEENEVAFKIYYRCVNGNEETSLGSEIYAYNVQTNTIRDLGNVD